MPQCHHMAVSQVEPTSRSLAAFAFIEDGIILFRRNTQNFAAGHVDAGRRRFLVSCLPL